MILPTITIKNILYATDLSENARYAYAYAVDLANRYNAKITILHVVPEDSQKLDFTVVGYISKSQWEAIKERNLQDTRHSLIGKKRDNVLIREVLTQFQKDSHENSDREEKQYDEIIIEKGNAVTHILEQAEQRNCDLIVMGSHGQSTLADVMMGSITSRVLRRSRIPVLVVRLPQAG